MSAARCCRSGCLCDAFLAAAHRWPGIGLASVLCACAGTAALATWLARISPYAEGSGIPEVAVALKGALPPMPLPGLLLVKFVGGLLAIGGALALGPEGPSVQMGAVGARLIGKRFRLGFALRFLFGAACYGVRAPGGLFAPILLLGAQVGLLCGVVSRGAFPALGIHPQAFAVVGMAAVFTGVVRAPITGIVLVIEMTAAFTALLPMLAAGFAAMVAADLTRIQPIDDSLRERLRDRIGGQEWDGGTGGSTP